MFILNVKTRAFLKKIPFLTISRFQNRVSYNLRKGASKSVCFLQKHANKNKVSGRSEIGRVLSSKVSWTLACRGALLENSFSLSSPSHFVSKFTILCENMCFFISGKRVPRNK